MKCPKIGVALLMGIFFTVSETIVSSHEGQMH